MQTSWRTARYSTVTRIERTPGDFAVLFGGLLTLTLLAAIMWWQFWHINRIYTGVTVAGIPVGDLTRAGAAGRLQRSLMHAPLPPVSLVYGDRQWPVTADQARASIDLLGAVNHAYLIGRHGNVGTRLTDQVAAALGGEEIKPAVAVDVGRVRYEVGRIANDIRKPARPARQIGTITVPAEPGIDVNVESTVQALMAALQNDSPGKAVSVPLQVIALAPPSSASTLADAPPAGTEAVPMAAPLRLHNTQTGLEFAIDPATLQGLIFSDQPIRVDEGRLRSLLAGWGKQIEIQPENARLHFDPSTQEVSVIQASRPGRQLDIDATMAAVEGALQAGKPDADLVVKVMPPAVDSSRIGDMGIRELVASGTTYFTGSSAARVHNIEVAAAKFDGVVIPPGGLFSFNKIVEDVTAANGFEDSLIIWGDRTAVGVGGGVCQVSTTVFRAAYLGGFPIVERYNHGYVVSWYGEPGMDATIYTPSVDFRFRNDTAAYLLIQPTVDAKGGTITFNLYGTKADRQVTISKPAISDVIEPAPPVYTVDDSLAKGQKKQVEWPKEGMTALVKRTIVENGTTRTDTLTSKYEPWRAVYLVGPGTEVPATPTPPPAANSNTTGAAGASG